MLTGLNNLTQKHIIILALFSCGRVVNKYAKDIVFYGHNHPAENDTTIRISSMDLL